MLYPSPKPIALGGGRRWWAHLTITPLITDSLILRVQIEERLEILESAQLPGTPDRSGQSVTLRAQRSADTGHRPAHQGCPRGRSKARLNQMEAEATQPDTKSVRAANSYTCRSTRFCG